MKKFTALILSAMFAAGALGIAACKDGGNELKITEIYNMYVASAKQNGSTPMSYEDWLNFIKNADDGNDKVEIKDASLDQNGFLIITFTNGTQKNCGKLFEDTIFAYSEIKDGEEVKGYTVRELYKTISTDIVVPSSYNGKPVLAIGESAFYECDYIKSVTIPDTVETIGELAFSNCINLESVVLGKNVKALQGFAFYQCYALSQINFPSSVETIGECAFSECASLKNADLNEGLKIIGDCAFGGCTSLEKFIMPNSVEQLGWGVLTFSGGAGFGAGASGENKIAQVVISDKITQIPQYAFSGCGIAGAEIGKSVQIIDYSAFYGCSLLQSVVIPKSVTQIVSYAFYRCSALDTVYYEGSAQEWAKVTVGRTGNDILTATVYYYSEEQPSAAGNYWHYADGAPVKW